MDKDRIAGAAKVQTGRIKDSVGKMAGDQKLRAEGKMEQATGKVQNAIGGMRDAARDADRNAKKQ